MAKKRRWWMIVIAVLTTALLTGCFRGAPKLPLQPFLTLIAPYPGATNVHPDHLSLFWEVDFREAELPQDEKLVTSRETPSIWYLVFFAQGNEDFGEPEMLQGGKNVFIHLDPETLEFETEYRWKIAALFVDEHLFISEEATFTTRPQCFESSLPPEMVKVIRGTFQMGDEYNDLPAGTKPVHNVELTYDYWIGKYEVTFAEYDAFCDATGRSKPRDKGWGRGTRPVIDVNWWDAIAYCNWLSDQNGFAKAYNSDGKLLDRNGEITEDITQVEGYRLPTEAEWEYAASGGHEAWPIPPRFRYAGSNTIGDVAWYSGNSGDSTQPVGGKQANPLGLHDMSGNVWEMCHDWYTDYTSANKINPIGPSSGWDRVIRGGSWKYYEACRVAYRHYTRPGISYNSLGFRLARTCP